jgi:histidinol-phosphatase
LPTARSTAAPSQRKDRRASRYHVGPEWKTLMSRIKPGEFVEAALTAVAAAGELIRKAYRGDFTVRYKADASPVTEIDEAAERTIKSVLRRHFPDHGFYGEEFGREAADAEYLWLIDPIDGTKAFVRGYPLFSVQLGLMHRGEIIAGVSHAPCWNEGELIWAEAGRGAWLGAKRLQLAPTGSLEKATLSLGNIATLARSDAWSRLGRIIPRLHRIRGYGDFLHYHWLAAGKLDAVIESDVNILDISALSLIVREAGGVFTDLSGAPLTLGTTSVLAAAPALHRELLAELQFRQPSR